MTSEEIESRLADATSELLSARFARYRAIALDEPTLPWHNRRVAELEGLQRGLIERKRRAERRKGKR